MKATPKICKGCGVGKPRTSFASEPRTKDGLRSRCNDCRNAQRNAWRAANPERGRAEAQRRKAYQREWRRNNPERIRSYRRPAQPHDFLTQWRKAQR